MSLLAKRELDRAAADFSEAIKLSPTMAAAYADRASARLAKNEFSEAVEDATTAIRLRPRFAEAYITRAAAHAKLGELHEARADYDKAIEMVPKLADLYLRRAEIRDALGQPTGAGADRARAASVATATTPSNAPAATQPAGNPSAFKVPGVVGSDDAVPRPPAPIAITALALKVAETQISRGEYDLAIGGLDKIIALEPRAWGAYALRGLAYSGKKDYRRANADASKAVELGSHTGMPFAVSCQIQLQLKAYHKALADCDKALAIGPPNSPVYVLRGNAHLFLKAYEQATADFDKAIAMGAAGPQPIFGRGLAHFYARNFAKAVDDFRKVLEAEPQHQGATLVLRLITQPFNTNAPMRVEIVRNADSSCGEQCAEWIAVQGRIDGSTPARFRAALASIGNRKLPIFVDSVGGSLTASYQIGRMIRARTLDIYVTRTEYAPCATSSQACQKAKASGVKFGVARGKLASCASACTNILASGTVRSVGRTALVGVHQAGYYFLQENKLTMAPTQRIPESVYVRLKDYFVEMGVDANIMRRLVATPHKDMYWLTQDELHSSRLANHTMSGEELVSGTESDDWLVASPKAAESLAKLTGHPQSRDSRARPD